MLPAELREVPLVVGIGGTTRSRSTTERALQLALAAASAAGARVECFGGAALAQIEHYAPERPERSGVASALIDSVRRADGLIVATPGYHGGVSGLVKNALDYLEDLRGDPRAYLDGRAVGCVVTALGSQAGGATLAALRATVHALRGWPTPLGAVVVGSGDESQAAAQLARVGEQVAAFALAQRAGAGSGRTVA